MMTPETIAKIKSLMAEASVFEEDLEEVRCGENRSREINRWLARRTLAERILAREQGRKSAEQQAREKKRRQKRRRSRRQKQRMLDAKHAHSEIKANRKPVDW